MSEKRPAPPAGGAHALRVSAAHLNVVLTSIGSYDGKVMFLIALNVAAISAQAGLLASANPIVAVAWLGVGASILNCLLGVWALWTDAAEQFPDPGLAIGIARRGGGDDNRIAWVYVAAMRRATLQARPIIIRKGRTFRALLITTSVALILLLVTAVTLRNGQDARLEDAPASGGAASYRMVRPGR